MIDTLKFIEFFVSEFEETASDSKIDSASTTIDSFFQKMDSPSIVCVSLFELLDGKENFLEVLSDEWSDQNIPAYRLPIAIEAFLKENQEELCRPEMKVRTILDYVYTVV